MTILRWAIEECELISAAGMQDYYTQEEFDIKTTEPVVYAAASTNTTLKCRNTTTA
jgi:hypothetical protein